MYNCYDYVIVGAGFFGCVLAEQLASKGNKVCIIERRGHIGGNCYDEYDPETGILYHKYGPHIFHANNSLVINYIKKFSKFTRYFHQVFTTYKNKTYQLPINLQTINTFYSRNLKPYEVADFLREEAEVEGITSPKNLEEKAISQIGRPLYEAFFREYTVKQWGKSPSDLSSSIFTRLPIRECLFTSYYDKKFQGLPEDGYTTMFRNMLMSENIHTKLNTDFFAEKNQVKYSKKLIFSGAIDQYFDQCFGPLEYRTVTFEREIMPVPDWQGTSVMNYAESVVPYTRISEPKHFYREKWGNYSSNSTLILKEFSSMDTGKNPFYPISDQKNLNLLEKYNRKAGHLKDVIFGGRLGDYKYYDMEDVIFSALSIADRLH
ncbi:MAG: UDP-galactopyranose mutase [Halodesulfovibrio sp.]|uniref:UDP-galactopyranose mutase n=1 Tax=Halodesulfovibrio sp. TaxID=1912772 RepID=UPI00359D85D1